MKNFALLFCLFLFQSSLFAQESAQGYVFLDANGNGTRDRKEQGLAGVSVSNGRDVAVTDANGHYSLKIGTDEIIFVIKPSGYQVRIDSNRQPRYFYVHKPNGSPVSKYAAFSPTGPLPASVDFPLVEQPEDETFTALVFGDPQPYTLEELEYFARGIVKEVEGVKNVQFGISLGDIVGDDLSLQKHYTGVIARAGVPWYNVMGNHDMNYDAAADSLSDETFERNFGPANYAFNYGKAHFIVLDDILYPDPRDAKGYWGGFRPDQLAFVANDLKNVEKDKLIVLAFHIPIANAGSGFRTEDRQRLFDLLRDFPNVLAMSAHTHLQRQNLYHEKDGWHGSKPFHEFNSGTPSGNWYSGEMTNAGVPDGTMSDGTPRGYSFLHIEGNQYKIDYKVAGKPASYQIRIHAPKVVPAEGRTSAAIYANFFMGMAGNAVQCRIDNGAWTEMVHTIEPDPYYLHLQHRYDHAESLLSGRRPGTATDCMHLWKSGIPANLAEGPHVIEVKATDMFGRTFTEKKMLWAEKR
ncbi:calcineurin-like phosphoesterase family protein [Ravibacter arvi]|uniref:Calcineurin-like phosphoesterase family protein n=1 Tax=Ravibacter arvi TaxID=2051041 RepID=A0ABP8MCQ3_9BACT